MTLFAAWENGYRESHCVQGQSLVGSRRKFDSVCARAATDSLLNSAKYEIDLRHTKHLLRPTHTESMNVHHQDSIDWEDIG